MGSGGSSRGVAVYWKSNSLNAEVNLYMHYLDDQSKKSTI